MAFALFTRRKYFQFLSMCVIIYACGQFIVVNQIRLSLLTQQSQSQTPGTAAFDKPGNYRKNATAAVESNSQHAQNRSAAASAKAKKVIKKKASLDKITNINNVSFGNKTKTPHVVIFNENEVQVQLKTIHEKGERIIKLQHDKCEQRLPQCLIIGNYKSGTQELIEFMFMHPRIRILREPLFELHFFGGDAYAKGIDWYRKQMPCSYTGQITVEKSPSYLQEPDSPGQIYKMDPGIKLIALVREPIERAFAHFTWDTGLARKYKNNFTNCVIDSKTREVTRDCIFIKHSIYDDGMERYLRLFNRSQILIIDSVDFKRDPFQVLNEIETFLDIEHVIQEHYFVYIKEKGFYCVRSGQNYMYNKVACYDKRRGRKEKGKITLSGNINNFTMKKLIDYFQPRNERFFQQIGRTLNWQYDMML